mgnify:CR=1 FL=1
MPHRYADSPKGVQGGERKATLLASMGNNFAVSNSPWQGLTRRLRREWWGCRPEGVVLSFEAKESTKESTRHGDSGKKAPIAHFDGGARNVARNGAG